MTYRFRARAVQVEPFVRLPGAIQRIDDLHRRDVMPDEVVGLANGRCDQENVIEQLKNGVNAMRMPVDDLNSNWAYVVMASLAWNLKAWFALLVAEREVGLELLKMEFRAQTFRQCFNSARGARERLRALIFANNPNVLDFGK